MRTVSPKHRKGEEPRRSWKDDLAVLLYIARGAVDYLFRGRRIRALFRTGQREAKTVYIEDI